MCIYFYRSLFVVKLLGAILAFMVADIIVWPDVSANTICEGQTFPNIQKHQSELHNTVWSQTLFSDMYLAPLI